MAEERDPKVSQRYRELGREEPSRELDQAIIAAAHRAADRPHAPLVAPAGRHRWYFASGAAAILVLSIAVTLHIDHGRPDAEAIATAPAPTPAVVEPAPRVQQLPSEQFRDVVPAEARIPEQRPQAAGRVQAPASIPLPSRREDAGVERQATPTPPIAAADNAPAAVEPTPRIPEQRPQLAARTHEERLEAFRKAEQHSYVGRTGSARERSPAAVPMGRTADARPPESPERWVERIGQLRKAGKQEEADKELAEFRRRYPDYKIPDTALRPAE